MLHGMNAPSRRTVEFQVMANGVVPAVDVSLRSSGDRWIATVATGGRRVTGLGSSARLALSAALTPLGEPTRTAVLADPALLAPSTQLAAR